ncbi:MAG: TonB-dependent receptor, partial [Pedobacter sp.]
MKKLLIVAMAILTPFIAAAQFSIIGKVSEKNSGSALRGAGISLENSVFSTQTDASGNYTIKNLKAGNYRIRVKYLGYQTLERSISLNGNISLDLELIPNSLVADEVLVRATRASENSASTYRNISKEELEKNNLGQDLPFLLNQTPSVVVSSDAGNGIGYTGIRIRGSDPTRLNVTINGIPYNDPESQGTYWVNLPDFASSVDNIQIQRGVGTSTNGAGAFGGSLNIQTTTKQDSAYAELNNTFGSYQTVKNTINAGTGLINNKFSFDGRLSRIKSDGYIDRGSSMRQSYFLR